MSKAYYRDDNYIKSVCLKIREIRLSKNISQEALANVTIPKYIIPGTDIYSNTPQGLYATIEGMKNIGNDSYGKIDIPGVGGYVGDSHGSCGN